MTITKRCETIRQAERYLEKLYGLYDYVRLIGFPSNTESGIYTFYVTGNDGTKVTIN